MFVHMKLNCPTVCTKINVEFSQVFGCHRHKGHQIRAKIVHVTTDRPFWKEIKELCYRHKNLLMSLSSLVFGIAWLLIVPASLLSLVSLKQLSTNGMCGLCHLEYWHNNVPWVKVEIKRDMMELTKNLPRTLLEMCIHSVVHCCYCIFRNEQIQLCAR